MSVRPDPLSTLSIPDDTVVEEHDLVTDGDVLIGAQSTVEFGIRGRNVVAGERVRFGGHIEAGGDCRLDTWCSVGDNVLVGEDAYLGERIEIDGQLVVGGDLDIGDDVQIAEGFEASGWIVIRNPMPTVVFLFMYLTHLLRMGEDDAAEELVDELFDEDGGAEPLTIPKGATVSDDAWRVSTPAKIGRDCRLHGNVRAESITVGEATEIFGSLRARDDIEIAPGAVVHGDVTTRSGTVTVADDARVWGNISCEHLDLARDGVVDGTIRARGEVNTGLSTDPDGSPQ
ncbi:UDP-3-O-(3-hydroxymyristoyl)glucosamine N-acyltransferase [Halalkalicoccus paucihalophilus]|uniref:UDP-3-O-(3-hydroxymyristoyl)glucosamine N-acyltransferase n=1 Tax=Halalkalicoccus paucihalophilus TaxID=1008153 RepID=A0A151AIW1_9EURY|nr:polymer-forming cytoskeletal protein [Halalkalicoccus paucihalophilus]KYH27347.1 UDP-3-O-(3-hydroxymyristoyl)glucosamine N-acyltransferase [Halalkalicoccus paucihalophilus]